MRITFLTHFPGRGGSTSMLLQLLRFFRSRGYETTVVVGRDCPVPIVDDYIVFSTRATNWRQRLRDYRDLIEATNPDVLYYVSGLEEADLLRFLECPRIRHVFTLEQHELLDVPYWLKQLSPYWEVCTANTPDVLEAIRINNDSDYLGLFVPYDVDPVFHSDLPTRIPDSVEPKSAIEVCCIGRLERYQKRAHWIPEVVQRCRDAGQKLRWHIYGEGPCEGEIRDKLTHQNCSELVEFHGWLETPELATKVARHDIFFSCSRFEGLPVAMVEAMFCGLACLVPDIPGGIRQLMKHGGGWLYDACTPTNASKALVAAAQSERLLEVKKNEARCVIMEFYGPEVTRRQCTELERTIERIRFNGRVSDLDNAPRLRLVQFRNSLSRHLRRLALFTQNQLSLRTGGRISI